MALDLTYPAILNLFGDFKAKGRTESKALLAWFLENYYRLEALEVDDAICDDTNDKGIDGVYVNDLLQQIDIFQTKIGTKNPVQQLGDTDLKEFVGTLSQFSSPAAVQGVIGTTQNEKLKSLLRDLNITKLVSDGYHVRGVFVTNRTRNADAIALLAHAPNLVLFDRDELDQHHLKIDKPDPIAGPTTFSTNGVGVLTHRIDPATTLVVVPVLASELVTMDGIINQQLFAWNLRYHLKRSPVNKDIHRSIEDPLEHKFFPAYHNGLTVLAENVEVNDAASKITINGYAVVNGCQSLSTLYENAALLTPDLRILTKIISVSPKSQLALKITDHTNRQNGITARDLQSNNTLQTRLQSDVHKKFPGVVYFRIARGEHLEWDSAKVIENDAIARILLAFDLKQPEACHQTYRLFDELHSQIFGRPEVTASRVVALWEIDAVIRQILPTVTDKAFGGYSLTPFLVHFLLREILELPESQAGDFVQNPEPFVATEANRAKLRAVLAPVVKAIVDTLGAEIKKRADAGNPVDHKRELKSPSKIKDFRSSVVPLYQMAVNANFTKAFGALWASMP